MHGIAEKRRSPRKPVYSSGTISHISAPGREHIAWVKDINTSGLCLFTRYKPQIGTLVQIKVESDPLSRGKPKQYVGTVVRVQEFGEQTALAVGVRFAQTAENAGRL